MGEPISFCLDEAGLEKSDIHQVVLVGGCSLVPAVRGVFQNFFHSKMPVEVARPDLAAVLGASAYALSLEEDPMPPVKEGPMSSLLLGLGLTVKEVTPWSMAPGVFGTVLRKPSAMGRDSPGSCRPVGVASPNAQASKALSAHRLEHTQALKIDDEADSLAMRLATCRHDGLATVDVVTHKPRAPPYTVVKMPSGMESTDRSIDAKLVDETR